MNSGRSLPNSEGQSPSRLHTRYRRRAIGVVLIAGASAAVASGAVYGANLGTSGGSIGTSSAALGACDDTMDNVKSPITRYVTGGRYEFAEATVSSVRVSCTGLAARISVVTAAGNVITAGGAGVSNGAATFTTSSTNTPVWTVGQGPLVNQIPNSNSDIKLVVVIRGG